MTQPKPVRELSGTKKKQKNNKDNQNKTNKKEPQRERERERERDRQTDRQRERQRQRQRRETDRETDREFATAKLFLLQQIIICRLEALKLLIALQKIVALNRLLPF